LTTSHVFHAGAGLLGRAAKEYVPLFFINRDNNYFAINSLKIALQDPK